MEMPPPRIFIFLVTMLGVFAVLVMTIPSGLIVLTDEYTQPEISEYFEAIDLTKFADTWEYTMNETEGKLLFDSVYQVDVDIGNRNFDFFYSKANYTYSTHPYVYMKHYFTTWLWFTDNHYMNWYNKQGIERSTGYEPSMLVSQERLEQDYPDNLPYTVKCSHFQVSVYFGYNETMYNNLTNAWNHHELNVLVGIDWDDMGTGLNAWNIISMMFTFQLPRIHPILNIIIGLGLWGSFAYITACIVLAFIQALPFT